MCSGKPKYGHGFTYIGLLIFIAVLAAGATASLGAGAALRQRDSEAELLAIGVEFRNALQSYADATPVGQPTAPKALSDLLRDPRYLGTKRHLRRVYPDPFTGKAEWGLVRDPDGRIAGIHSLSATPVLRRTGFPVGMETFEKSERYDEWVFALMPTPQGAPSPFPPALKTAGS